MHRLSISSGFNYGCTVQANVIGKWLAPVHCGAGSLHIVVAYGHQGLICTLEWCEEMN